MSPAVQRAVEIRNRLRNPPNAVLDTGIDLRRKVVPIRPEPVVEMPCDCDPSPTEQEMIAALVEPRYGTEEHLAAIEILREKVRLLRGEMTSLMDRFEGLDVQKDALSRPKIKIIQDAVCRFYGVEMCDLQSSRRTANIVKPRQVAMWLAKKLTLRSLPEVGRLFDRDHTTVLHAVRKIDAQRNVNQKLKEETDILIFQIVGDQIPQGAT